MSAEEKKVLPGHETQSQEMNCPNCGRYAGAVTKCPYCGSPIEKRLSLVSIRWAAVLLSTVGLFLLFLMAKHREVPVVLLGDVAPTMNFGQIRIVGTVDSDARTFRNGGMGFNVSDGTGSITVFVSQKQALDLTSTDLVPRAGDGIELAGALNISDDQMSMRLLSSRHVKLNRAPVLKVALGSITTAMKGQSISVAGKITGVVPPAPGTRRPYDIKIQDDTGTQTINCWQAEFDGIPNNDALAGAYAEVRVSVDTYQNKLQLILSSGSDVKILDAPPAPAEPEKTAAQKAAETLKRQEEAAAPQRDFGRGRRADATPIASITAENAGQTVKVRGAVVFAKAPEKDNQPFTVILKEDDASISVKYWSNVDQVLADKPQVGAEFEIEGEVDVFRDTPQIKVVSGYKMRQLTAPGARQYKPRADAPRDVVDVAAIDHNAVGSYRTVAGKLGAPRDLSEKGTAYTLTDDSGSIDLILWNTSISQELREKLAEGVSVSANGKVGIYEDVLQLAPGADRFIQIVE